MLTLQQEVSGRETQASVYLNCLSLGQFKFRLRWLNFAYGPFQVNVRFLPSYLFHAEPHSHHGHEDHAHEDHGHSHASEDSQDHGHSHGMQ